MSPKIKMSDIHDERDDDIIELSDEELKEILADDDFDIARNAAKSILSFSLIPTRMPRSSLAPMMPPSVSLLSMKRATSLSRICLPFGCPM